jgi:hypothetical protein
MGKMSEFRLALSASFRCSLASVERKQGAFVIGEGQAGVLNP